MRFITTGVDTEGRSCVLSIEEHGQTGTLWSTPSVPPDLGYARARAAGSEAPPSGLAPGSCQCVLVALAPGTSTQMHQVGSYSIVTMTAGVGVLRLEMGSVELRAGDVATLPALVHQWQAGPAGCQFSSMRFGVGEPSIGE